MNTKKRCCFAGHNKTYGDDMNKTIKDVSQILIDKFNVCEFWVGNYGGFDTCAATAIRELKNMYKQIELDLVIPYLTKDIHEYKEWYYERYDEILIANISASVPKKFQIIKSNEYMVSNSNFLICCIDHSWGGAFRTYNFAKRKKLNIFNISKSIVEQ